MSKPIRTHDRCGEPPYALRRLAMAAAAVSIVMGFAPAAVLAADEPAQPAAQLDAAATRVPGTPPPAAPSVALPAVQKPAAGHVKLGGVKGELAAPDTNPAPSPEPGAEASDAAKKKKHQGWDIKKNERM